MFVQHRRVEAVEQVVAFLLVLLEQLQVLEDALLHRHLVVVANGIFTEEVKDDDVLLSVQVVVERHVLVAERAAADGVRLIFVLLVT